MRNGLPVVAIVGRPNVGKSSLFNMLTGSRKSIVDDMPGVTRDINMEKVDTPRSHFFLYDTAGYLEKGDSFNALVQQKVRQAVADADMILFMVDGRDYHPVDEQLGNFLRQMEKPVLVVANKLDNNEMDDAAYEFYNLGFEEVLAISVLHKRGFSELTERIEHEFEEFNLEELAPEELKIALVGKPNVGKSSLLNSLLGYDRSIVSDIPGTTRDSLDDILDWNGSRIRLIDTAGLRRKAKVSDDIEYYSNVRSAQAIESADVVIQLLDANEEISHQDKQIARTVIEKGRALIVAYNKWDQVNTTTAEDNYVRMKEAEKVFRDEYPEYFYVPLYFISAKDDYKIEKLMDAAFRAYADYHFRVPTSDLNNWLETQVEEYEGVSKRKSNFKIYYVTQSHSAPPRFVFFINRLKDMRKDYPRFIEKRLRLAFEFFAVPLKLNFREKEKKPHQKSRK